MEQENPEPSVSLFAEAGCSARRSGPRSRPGIRRDGMDPGSWSGVRRDACDPSTSLRTGFAVPRDDEVEEVEGCREVRFGLAQDRLFLPARKRRCRHAVKARKGCFDPGLRQGRLSSGQAASTGSGQAKGRVSSSRGQQASLCPIGGAVGKRLFLVCSQIFGLHPL